MFYLLVTLFILLPLCEIAILIHFGSYLGLANTILIILFTGILGAYLARSQGVKILLEIQKSLQNGVLPQDQILDGLMILIAGAVLLTPGFITDAAGFFVLWPLGRKYVRQFIQSLFKTSIQSRSTNIRYFRQNDID